MQCYDVYHLKKTNVSNEGNNCNFSKYYILLHVAAIKSSNKKNSEVLN